MDIGYDPPLGAIAPLSESVKLGGLARASVAQKDHMQVGPGLLSQKKLFQSSQRVSPATGREVHIPGITAFEGLIRVQGPCCFNEVACGARVRSTKGSSNGGVLTRNGNQGYRQQATGYRLWRPTFCHPSVWDE